MFQEFEIIYEPCSFEKLSLIKPPVPSIQHFLLDPPSVTKYNVSELVKRTRTEEECGPILVRFYESSSGL